MELSSEQGDLEDLLRAICFEFGVSEKDFMSDWRLGVRELWSVSTLKRTAHSERYILVENKNPKSMKRFPMVKRWKCEICLGLFSKDETELDHVLGENPCRTFSDAADFLHSIALPRNKADLQVLCKECHGIKTYAERYKVTLEEARIKKLIASLRKSKTAQENKLKELGIQEIPKSAAARERLLTELLMAQIGDKI